MRKLAVFSLLFLSSLCHATTTVTGTIGNLGTGTVTNSYVRFWLRGCKGANPRVNGTAIIAPSQGGVYYFDLPANGSGVVSGTIYSTRDGAGTGDGEIECNNSKTAEWYGMQVFYKGQAGPEVAVHAQLGVTMDITSVIPIVTPPMSSAGNQPLGAGAKFVTTNLSSTTPGHCAIWLTGNVLGDVACTGTGDLMSAPATNQTVTQPKNTTFAPNNLQQVRYAVNYNWSQSPVSPASIIIGSNTVTINAVLGVSAYSVSKVKHYLWIAGTGTPERVLITATTCTGVNTGTCTVTFTAANTHAAGYSLASATAGFQEAWVDAFPVSVAANPMVASKIAGSPTNNNANIYVFNAPLDIDMQRGTQAPIVIDGQGSTISCNTSGLACINLGTGTAGTLTLQPIGTVFENFLIMPALGMGRTADGTTVAIHDEGQKTKLENIFFGAISGTDVFDDLVVVDDDQMFTEEHVLMNDNNPPMTCDSTYCGFGLKGTSLSSGALGYIYDSDYSMQCKGNGIDWQSGNTLHVNDTVIQAFNQVGVRAKGAFDVNPAVMLTNVYNEIGICTNPMGTGQAGLIIENGWGRGEGNVGPEGQLAAFTASVPGATVFAYYVVVKSSTLGTSNAFLAGQASTNGTGSVTVKFPQVGSTGTITYDLLRIQQNALSANAVSPYTAFCTGGSAAACGSVQTGITTASCAASLAGNTCTVTDSDVTASTTSYTVSAPSYSPLLSYWPGSIILSPSSDTNNTHNGSSTYWVTDRVSGGGIVSAAGDRAISVIAQNCNGFGSWSSGFVSCLVPDTTTGQISPARIAMMGASPNPTSKKGIVINEFFPVTTSASTDLYTFADSNPEATAGTSTNRPNSDPNDTAIGLDNANAATSGFRLGYRAPVGHRWYVGSIFDNTNWKMQLNSSGLTIASLGASGTKCVQADNNGLLSLAGGACGSSTGATVTGSPASGNLTKFSGASSITNGDLSGDVTTSGTLAATVVKVNGGSLPASAVFVGTDGSGKIQAQKNRRIIGYTFGDPAGSALSTSTVGYVVAPAACTIVGWDILVDTGTATVTTWKIASGTAIPTVANSISTSGVAISSGTAVHSTTVSDFTTTTVTANDIFGFNISAVSGAHYLYFDLQCDQ